MTPRFVVYRDKSPERRWRWRLVGGNGERCAMATEGYRDRADALRAVDDVVAIVLAGPAVTG